MVINFSWKRDALWLGAWGEYLEGFKDRWAEVEILLVEVELVIFKLCKVQQVIDEVLHHCLGEDLHLEHCLCFLNFLVDLVYDRGDVFWLCIGLVQDHFCFNFLLLSGFEDIRYMSLDVLELLLRFLLVLLQHIFVLLFYFWSGVDRHPA